MHILHVIFLLYLLNNLLKACVPLSASPFTANSLSSSRDNASPGVDNPISLADSSAIVMSLMKCLTKNPGAKSSSIIRGARLDKDQLPAAQIGRASCRERV